MSFKKQLSQTELISIPMPLPHCLWEMNVLQFRQTWRGRDDFAFQSMMMPLLPLLPLEVMGEPVRHLIWSRHRVSTGPGSGSRNHPRLAGRTFYGPGFPYLKRNN